MPQLARNEEPFLDEVFADQCVQTLMARDGVTPASVLDLLRQAAEAAHARHPSLKKVLG